jgi:hypothetical protein
MGYEVHVAACRRVDAGRIFCWLVDSGGSHSTKCWKGLREIHAAWLRQRAGLGKSGETEPREAWRGPADCPESTLKDSIRPGAPLHRVATPRAQR